MPKVLPETLDFNLSRIGPAYPARDLVYSGGRSQPRSLPSHRRIHRAWLRTSTVPHNRRLRTNPTARPVWTLSEDPRILHPTRRTWHSPRSLLHSCHIGRPRVPQALSLIHISEPTRLRRISYAVFCLKKKKK